MYKGNFLKKWILAVAISTALMGCASQSTAPNLPTGVKLIESVSISDSQVGIPYKKYQLANGLTVILHQDTSDPLVHLDVTYHVGSARELAGRSGFAHLFEHMMFQGSQHVADEQHFEVVTEAGGTLNGSTNTDRTNYYETVPSNQLEKMLWLESDRMGFFLPALTAEKFEVQRETVKNERAQRIDNQPYGQMTERFNQAFYPTGHPYSWPVIGWPADLDRADVNDVKQFFQRWYGPNNATLTIGGDFDEVQTLAWINQYFGEIPRGPEVLPEKKPLVSLDKTRYISMEDQVHLPLVRIAFPTVYARHEDEAALDLLGNILGGGKTSILYKNLVKEGYAIQASASHPCQELACQFSIFALANPAKGGGKLADLEQQILDSINEFELRGVTDDDLQKVKVQIEAATVFGMQSVSGKVSMLALNETLTGNPNLTAADLARYAKVTKADVMRVFKQYIKDKPMVVMSVVPQGMTDLVAHADNFTPSTLPVAQAAVEGELKSQPTTTNISSSVDRSVMPKALSAPMLKVPSIWSGKLANGIEVMGTQSSETPTVELVIYLNGGHRIVPTAQAGLALLTAEMLNESSRKRSSEELTQALEMIGSTVDFSATATQSVIKVSALTEHLDETLAIVEEKLFMPAFNTADFARVKEQQLQRIAHLQAEPNYLADSALAALLYGPNNPQGIDTLGTLTSVNALTLADVQAFYQTQYRAGNAQIITVANLSEADLLPKLAGLNQWQGEATPLPPLKPLPSLKTGTIYLLDKPGAAQSVINIAKRALPFDATGDYFKSYLMNYPLGGAFNSRINLNLREQKGYTYGARSSFDGGEEVGDFVASSSVRSDVTAKAVAEFIKEISTYQQQGMTDAELAFMRNSVSQSQALDYETPYQKAGFMRMIQRYQLSQDFTTAQDKIIKTVTKDELNALAASQLDLQQMIILVVGDKAKIAAELEQLGYPIETLVL